MKKISLLLFAACFCTLYRAQTISPIIAGQAYFYTDFSAPTNPTVFTSTSPDWSAVSQSGCTLIRVGGKQYNLNNKSKPPANNEIYYVKIIDDIRSHGCEPVLTIPFTPSASVNSYTEAVYTAAVIEATTRAQKIIRLVNQVHKRNLRYVIVANEPGQDYGWTQPSFNPTVIAQNIAGYIKPIAQAIKEIDPSIKIIGPEYEQYDTALYDLLFSSSAGDFSLTSCVSGTISSPSSAAGLAYLDFASFHSYLYNFSVPAGGTVYAAYNPSAVTTPTTNVWDRDRVYTEHEKYKKNNDGEPASAPKKLRGAMRDIRQKCNDVTSTRGIPLGWMITEANASQNNELTNYGQPNNVSGMDARSMLGAQNLARIYALAMEYGATAVMMWSVREGCDPNEPTYPNDRGFLDCTNGDKRASWYHYELMAKYFKGTYMRDEELAAKIGSDLTSEPTTSVNWMQYNSGASGTYMNLIPYLETKAFGAKGGDIVIMILNHKTSAVSAAIQLSASTPTGTAAKKFSFNAGINTQVDFTNSTPGQSLSVLPAESTTMLFFDCNGILKQRTQYTAATEAATLGTAFSSIYAAGGYSPFLPTSVVSPSAQCIDNLQNSVITVTVPAGAFVNWYKLPSTTPLPGNPYNTLQTFEPGLYKTAMAGGSLCSVYEMVTPVYRTSPLVDAGPDVNLCTSTVQSIGMVSVTLPSGQTYAWSPPTYTDAVKSVDVTNTPSTTGYVLTASAGGCSLSDGVIVVSGNTTTPDVMIKDSPDDLGNQPNNESGTFWSSEDIWVRNANDAGTTHQNPVGNTTNYINVLITNRSCADANSVTLTVYHTKAGAGSTWSVGWAGTPSCSAVMNFTNCSASLLCGGTIGTTAVNVGPASSVTQTLAWSVPNISGYTCVTTPGFSNGHWCLQAHLDHPLDAINSPSALTNHDQTNMYNKNNHT